MSTTIDQKVVEMRFDNKNFENNVSTTMSTLDKLKKKLNFTGAAKGLENVNATAKGFQLSGLGAAVESVQAKFSALSVIGVTALANITNSAVNAGKRIVSALTIDPVKTGFQEYETQMNAVQTILANTQSKGSTLDDVNKALDTLNTYADKTIYNFTEMTKNIGTFTAAGIDLETSVTAIQGIANLAAVSGSTSQQASTAMYQLSQALASGTVKLMDWNSVVNAGMGGEIFQNALKKTSELLGTGAEAAIEAEGSFRESLKTGWLTSEVLTETLKKFTTSGANEYVAEYTGLSTDAIQTALNSAKAQYGEADAVEHAAKALAEKSGKNETEIKEALQMARTAEDAATKVKTLTQLWDTLKESAQSGWTQTWEIMIGDFEEAKALFTKVSDTIGAMISESAESRNNLLAGALGEESANPFKNVTENTLEWSNAQLKAAGYTEKQIALIRKLGQTVKETNKPLDVLLKGLTRPTGRELLIESLWNTFDAILKVIKPIKEAFRNIFPPTTSNQLYEIIENLNKFTKSLSISEKTADRIKRTFQGVFSIFDIGKKIISAVAKSFYDLTKSEGVSSLADSLLDGAASIGDFFTSLNESFNPSGLTDVLSSAVSGISDLLKGATDRIKNFGDIFSYIGDGIAKVACKIWNAIKTVFSFIRENISAGDIFAGLAGGGIFVAAKKLSGFLDKIIETIKGIFGKGEGGLKDKISDIFDSLHDSLMAFSSGIKVSSLVSIAIAIGILSASLRKISELDVKDVGKSLLAIGLMLGMLSQTMRSITKSMSTFGSKGLVKAGFSLLLVASAIRILAGAMKKMSELRLKDIAKGLIGIGWGLVELSGALKIIGKTKISLSTSIAMLALAESCNILGDAMKKFAGMSWDEIGRGLSAMGGALGELVVSTSILNKFGGGKSIFGSVGILITVQSLEKLCDALKKFAEMSWEEIKRGLSAMGGALGELTIALSSIGRIAGFSSIFASGAIWITVQSLDDLASALQSFAGMTWDEIKRGLSGMGGALGEVAVITGSLGKLTGFSGILGSGAILITVQSLGDLADGLQRFADMTWEEIKRGLVGMGGALTEVGTVTGLLGGLTGLSGILGGGAILLAVQSLGDLADGMKKFAGMTWDEIKRGLVGMGGALTEVGTISGLLGGLGGFASIIGGGSVLLAVQGLGDLADAFKKFGEMSWDEIERGLSSIGGALGEIALGGLANTLSIIGSMSISKIAEPLGTLADSVNKWADVTVPDDLGAKLGQLGVGINQFTFGGLGASALATSAPAVGVMADSVKKWTDVNIPEDFSSKMSGLADAISEFTWIGMGAGSLSVAAPALGSLADSAKKWSGVTIPDGLEDGLKSIANGVKAFSWAFMGGWSINAIISPLAELPDSIKKWNGVTIQDGLEDGLKSIANGVKAFSWAFMGGWSIEEIVGPLGDLVDSVKKWTNITVPDGLEDDLKSIADGVKAFSWAFLGSWSIDSVAGPLGDLANSVKKWSGVSVPDGLEDKLKSLANGVKSFSGIGDISNVTNGIKTIASSVKNLSGINFKSISSNLTNLFNSIKNLSSIDSVSSSISKFGRNLVSGLITPIKQASAQFATVGSSIMDSISKGIASKSQTVTASATRTMNQLARATNAARPMFTSAGGAIMMAFGSGISSKSSAVAKALTSSINSGIVSANARYGSFYSAGSYLVQGFANGISLNSYVASNAAKAMAKAAASAAKEALNINSPSKVFRAIGMSVPEGFAMGIDKFSYMVKSSVSNMGDSAINGINKAISNVASVVNTDIDTRPTIRPILDLSDISGGMRKLDGMFNTNPSVGVLANVGSISTMMNQRSQNGGNTDVVSAIDKLRSDFNSADRATYNINGITYDDGSNLRDAIETIIRYANIERRV